MSSSDKTEDGTPVDRQARRASTLWHAYLTGDQSNLDSTVKAIRGIFSHLPGTTRCRVCSAPFEGVGGAIVGLFGFGAGRSSFNPTLCDRCEKLVKKYEVGTEVELTMLFADVRGSTALAEQIGASAFHHLINRFYTASADVFVQSNALIDKLVGDQVIGLYGPGIAGPHHAQVAIDAAVALLEATGHSDPDGPWIEVGVGVHTGSVYVGAVGSSQSVSDITVLGDAANTTARLASEARTGEILVSEQTCHAAQKSLAHCEVRDLHVKGRTQSVAVRSLRVASPEASTTARSTP
jgi:adenylate cyclase